MISVNPFPRPTRLARGLRAALLGLPLAVVLPVPALAAPAPAPAPTPASATAAATVVAQAPTPAAPATSSAAMLTVATLDAVEVTGEAPERYRERRTRTATKADTLLRDVPQSITVVTDEMIRDQAMRSMADVVRMIPGVQMAQGEGHRDAPILRGNTTTADFFVDGLRDDVQYYRDLYNVERVEALKGASGMIFGRGASGGLINRVTKWADWTNARAIDLSVGGNDAYRVAADFDYAGSDRAAFRVTGVFEQSGSWRDHVDLRRRAINPTATFRTGDATTIELGFEHFEDDRITDRGVPSQLPERGAPIDTDSSTFFGSPARSPTWADVDAFTARISHDFGSATTLTNHTRLADYDKYYQNVFPAGYLAATDQVAITGYSNFTARRNLLNQTDLTTRFATGAVEHEFLAGVELGRQVTDNFRRTAYFTDVGATATTDVVTLPDTIYDGAIEFRQSATDADNHGVARDAALYVQDRLEFTPHWQALLGVRYDRFDADLRNDRTGLSVEQTDGLWSPRAGLVWKPRTATSLYATWSVSHVPRAGEQLASLTPGNRALAPETFTNREVGLKWDVTDRLEFTAAAFRLDRSNVAVVDPADPSRMLLVDGQRVDGVELGLAGRLTDAWQVMAGYAWQDGEVRTPGAQDGNALGQVPEHAFSVWNRFELSPAWSAGVGAIHRGDVYVATDNLVVIDDFTRVDAALYYAVNPGLRLQLNVENLFDTAYFASAHGNNNLMPGSPRAYRVGVAWTF